MRFTKALILNILVLSACTEPLVLTQRDIARQVGAAFCEKTSECGSLAPHRIYECTDYNTLNLCEEYLSCSEILTEEEQVSLQQCAEDFVDHPCSHIFWGIIPKSRQSLLW